MSETTRGEKLIKQRVDKKKPVNVYSDEFLYKSFPTKTRKENFFVLFGFMTLISRNSFNFYFLDFFFGYDDNDVMMGFYFKYRFLAVTKGAVN